ncbi:kek4 [Drosophila busckii]|uniref:Kek4 n=1 Tax=Drosophila busckii TaxID=30019 RepID=A0A0M4ERD9_DROBS|nr:amphoterin-induced protein 1 [Drosophila busckii]XP_017850367.1 amphoterin-induced protein 1 [Drosophila busckii]ALC48677.1 kek4 [Drosophila busckii]
MQLRRRRRNTNDISPVWLLLSLLLLGDCAADWLMDCGNCHCKWNSGKKTADCRNLSLSAVPENLSSELQVLDLSLNRITYIEQNAFLAAQLQNLHKLYIRNSSLQQINAHSFAQLEILIELDLSNNLLRELQPNVFARLIKVRALLLNGNLLQSLDAHAFHNLKYLHKIELKHNRLLRIDVQAFSDLPLLSQIYLDGNRLSFLRAASFDTLKRLTALSLDQNPWNCTCELQVFRDFVVHQNLYTPPTACYYPLELRGMLWIEDQPQAFACKPKIIYPARGASINTSKENVTLVCRVHGSPNTIVAWDYNKQLYRSNGDNERVHIQLLREQQQQQQLGQLGQQLAPAGNIFISRLTILGAVKSDEGIYTCLAENAGGKDAVQMSLLVQKSNSRDLLLHSNLFVVICLMSLGLLSVSVLLSMITCCIYRRFKQLHPSQHHAHLHQLNLSPQQQLTSTSTSDPLNGAPNIVIASTVDTSPSAASGAAAASDAAAAVENTSLSSYKHHPTTDRLQETSTTATPTNDMQQAHSKYADVILLGTGATSTLAKRSAQRQQLNDLYLKQKSTDTLSLRPTAGELSRASSRLALSSESHSEARITHEFDYQPDLLPEYRGKISTLRGAGNGNATNELPVLLPGSAGGGGGGGMGNNSSRSKYNINVQEYLQAKYGSVPRTNEEQRGNNNKQKHVNGHGYRQELELPSGASYKPRTLSQRANESAGANYALERHSKSLIAARIPAAPTENYSS